MAYSISISVDKQTVLIDEPLHVSGKFTKDGEGVPEATVELYINNAKVYETTTDELGNYIFEVKFSKAGRYSIFVNGVEPEQAGGGAGGEQGGQAGGGGGGEEQPKLPEKIRETLKSIPREVAVGVIVTGIVAYIWNKVRKRG